MILFPLIPLVIVTISGVQVETHVSALSTKYFSHLSDTDLDNFETYYHLMRTGLPMQA